jgi:hypothetical protein
MHTSVCRGWTEPGMPCPNPTTSANGFCPLHEQRPGFGGRFRRTSPNPVHPSYAWRKLAKRTVEAWVATHGWTCPGWRRTSHPVTPGQLAAAHPVGLAMGGEALPTRVGVLCPPCNARQGLSERRRR